jgi:hypothetical protein
MILAYLYDVGDALRSSLRRWNPCRGPLDNVFQRSDSLLVSVVLLPEVGPPLLFQLTAATEVSVSAAPPLQAAATQECAPCSRHPRCRQPCGAWRARRPGEAGSNNRG